MEDKEVIYNLAKELYRFKGIVNNAESLANEAYREMANLADGSTELFIKRKIIEICNLVDAVSDVEGVNNG